jgi:hypothetical protein
MQHQRSHPIGGIRGVTTWSSVPGRVARPRVQPRLHPLAVKQRESQPVSASVTSHVTSQILIARDLLWARTIAIAMASSRR